VSVDRVPEIGNRLYGPLCAFGRGLLRPSSTIGRPPLSSSSAQRSSNGNPSYPPPEKEPFDPFGVWCLAHPEPRIPQS
jgi:hypothetical protein